MAKKKFRPKVTSVEPDKFSPFVRRHFDRSKRFSNEQLSHIANTGHRKARFRASFRARMGRMPGLTNRFFRLFSMFLVCLVLFATVTNASYSSYKETVGGLYMFTESVSDAAQIVVNGLVSVGEWTSNLKEASSSKEGEQYEFHVKISGSFYRFRVKYIGKVMWSSQYEILVAYNGYDDWVGMTFCHWLGWVTCPDYGMRAYKIYELPEGE